MRKHAFLNLAAFLSTLSISQQLIIVVLVLLLLGISINRFFLGEFVSERHVVSTASYDGLDPDSSDYWLERTIRDIESAQAVGTSAAQVESTLVYNISATIQAAKKLQDPLAKANAIASIIKAQIDLDNKSNLEQAYDSFDDSVTSRQAKFSILPSIAFFYAQKKDKLRSTMAIRDFLSNIKDYPVDPGKQNDLSALNEFVGICYTLDMTDEVNRLFQYLSDSARTTKSETRREALYEFVIEYKYRLRNYEDAFDTMSQLQTPQSIAKISRIVIEDKANISAFTPAERPGDSGTGVNRSPIRNRDDVYEVLDRLFDVISKLTPKEKQFEVFRILFESDIMTHLELRDLIRTAITDTKAIDIAVKTDALSVIDNPRPAKLRIALGLPPLEGFTEDESDLQLISRVRSSLLPASSEKKLLYSEDMRILINTSQELLKWGKAKEAAPLLSRAFTLGKGLAVDHKTNISPTSIAALMIGAGDLESAKNALLDSCDLLALATNNKSLDSDYAQIADMQLRGRFLSDAKKTLDKMVPSNVKNTILRNLALEQLRIGLFDEAIRAVYDMSLGTIKDETSKVVFDTSNRLKNRIAENTYDNPALKSILESGGEQSQTRILELVESQIRNEMVIDARETARTISDRSVRDDIMKRIVRTTLNLVKPYAGDEPLHQQVRRALYHFGIQMSRDVEQPDIKAECFEQLYSQLGWMVPGDGSDMNEAIAVVRSLEVPRFSKTKSTLLINLSQTLAKKTASRTSYPVSGTWCVIDSADSKNVETLRLAKELLGEAATISEEVGNSTDRLELMASLSWVYYQLSDSENGNLCCDKALTALEDFGDWKRSTIAVLMLAQGKYLHGDHGGAAILFELAISTAKNNELGSGKLSEVQQAVERKTSDRFLSDIARGQAEIGEIEAAYKTSTNIGEDVYKDRLYKTIGYILLNEKKIDAAERAFQMLSNEQFRTVCLKDAAYRRIMN